MEKVITRGFILIAIFIGSWFLLQQINWISALHLGSYKKIELLKKAEKELGEMMILEMERDNERVTNDFVKESVDSLVTRICNANNIRTNNLRVYIFENSEVNAFALPDRQLVIYTGLIDDTKTAEALSGVIAHELAHIEKDHVIQSLSRELAISTLLTITGNGSVIKDIMRTLSSNAFSREMEKEADLTGLAYLEKAHIDPKPMAEFLGLLDDGVPSGLEWLSTHPVSKDRKEYILKRINAEKKDYQPIIAPSTWEQLKDSL